ncbi:MAG: NAD-dependent epimerase/dehydratase family protein [Rhizobiaceae bacterium]|nr:NAD-dependent epimerase/dehydratase family protein [Rhizobiaceae bacterium]MCV0408984.1 NAD-dependent epimerase/dehydratase family protein [Rhizobiaceae bacterium]
MARMLITGAAGFIGERLTRALVAAGDVGGADGVRRPITSLCLVDRRPPSPPPPAGMNIQTLAGDLSDGGFIADLAARDWDGIFHLAASLTLEAEREDGPAHAVNVEALRRLIEEARHRPRLIFASSIAVFGGTLPDTVDDTTPPAPETSYGTHKAMAELLIADASRKGRVDGRALRLPIVLTRPGAPSPAISDRVAAIVRDVLAGRDLAVPLAPETVIPVASVGSVVRSLIALHDLPPENLPARRFMNMPALSVSVAEMIEALKRMRTEGSDARIAFSPDEHMQAIVDGWPRRFVSRTASALGIGADRDFETLVRDYLDNGAGGGR